MPRYEPPSEAWARRDYEALLAAIRNGEVEAIEDLDEHEAELLMEHAQDGEELEDLLDRLRESEPDPA